MFGISGEHILVLLVILLIFGPKRLPDLGHSIGRTLKNFKDGMSSHHDAQDKIAERERLEAKAAAASPVAPVTPVTPVAATPVSTAPTAEGPATDAAQATAQALGQANSDNKS
ncbi:MAG: twin-arginine translocase TatA/TatE family subunit [Proteobacteria bacterium]|nr:MAG: twin-arginine translocase TatA/TatE family subunit [Pseudomonadota bacterium]